MPNLIATGKDPLDRWERSLPEKPVTLGRLDSDSEWATPWDKLISRRHATLVWQDGRLKVQKDPSARNPILYQGIKADEFTVGLGEQFIIGNTTFEICEFQPTLVPDLPTPVTRASFGTAELDLVKFSDADTRIEVLAALPGVIRNAPSVEDLQTRVVDVLLQGITRAESAAIVRIDLPASGGEPTIQILCERSRSKGAKPLKPSRNLIVDATRRRRQSILHLWLPGDLNPGYTPNLSFDWAICSPLPDEPSPGLALYLSGSFEAIPTSLTGSDQKEHLKPDVKFAGLVADIFGAILQVIHLQRREAQFSLLVSEQVREALVGRDMEIVLAPRETEVTVLFCDLRGSSRVADDHPDELEKVWQHVSTYLGIMTGSINDQGGVIGDFQGDAAMGFWGWPCCDDEQVERVARAALTIRKKFLLESQKKFQGLTGFQCGIGIASGRAIAGRLGTYEQAKVGVYGPRVNLASRLESITKILRVPILIDDVTAERIRAIVGLSWARVRRLARIKPYGMAVDIMVSELLPPASEVGALPEQDRRDYEAALDAFLEGDWPFARELLARLHRDGPSAYLLKFMEAHRWTCPTNWDGIIVMDSK